MSRGALETRCPSMRALCSLILPIPLCSSSVKICREERLSMAEEILERNSVSRGECSRELGKEAELHCDPAPAGHSVNKEHLCSSQETLGYSSNWKEN